MKEASRGRGTEKDTDTDGTLFSKASVCPSTERMLKGVLERLLPIHELMLTRMLTMKSS